MISFHINQQNLDTRNGYKGPILWIVDKEASLKNTCLLQKELANIHTTKRTKDKCEAILFERIKRTIVQPLP
jgi:hypothetical protein